MTTEADWSRWTPAQLQPYFDTVLDAFGPRRLMFGSDWPVSLLASSYLKWVRTVGEWTAPLSKSENERIWCETASEAYRLTGNPKPDTRNPNKIPMMESEWLTLNRCHTVGRSPILVIWSFGFDSDFGYSDFGFPALGHSDLIRISGFGFISSHF